MKRFFYFAIAALTLVAVSCDKEKKGGDIDWSQVTVNGFYVAGPATGSDEIKADCVMAAGFNEVDKAVREGMYEKYIVLEGGKDFYLLYNDGGVKTQYGADLQEFVTPLEEVYNDNPEKVLKGKMIAGEGAPVMKVEKTGLYHIVLDINKAGDLKEPQILLLDASDFGVRGGMNGWGFTSSDPKVTEFSNEGVTFTFKNQELAKNGEFKFSTGNYWKVTLDDAGKVKAEVSLAAGMTLNGDNIKVEKGGLYDITLNFKLAQGSFDKSFTYTAVCTQESSAPETMYMIGAQFGGWSWDSDGVAELVPVWGTTGKFWCTRWFDKDQGFKFCAVKAWNGDFTGAGTVGYSVADGNCWVPETGFYTVFVDGNEGVVEIAPAKVFGFGDAVFTGGWDFDSAEEFVAEGDKMVITTSGAGELRMASKVVPTVADDQCTPNGWYDWWKTEFVFYEDGKIVYRAGGGDQARFNVEGGKKISLDFNAGTATIEDAVAPAIVLDGDFADWAEVPAFAGINNRITEWKATSDEKNLYLYFKITKEKIKFGTDSYNWKSYIYMGFDTDNSETSGVAVDGATAVGCESMALLYPWRGAVEGSPEIVNGEDENGKIECPVGTETGAKVSVAGVFDGEWCILEAAISREKIGATAAGTIAVTCAMDWYGTGKQVVEL